MGAFSRIAGEQTQVGKGALTHDTTAPILTDVALETACLWR